MNLVQKPSCHRLKTGLWRARERARRKILVGEKKWIGSDEGRLAAGSREHSCKLQGWVAGGGRSAFRKEELFWRHDVGEARNHHEVNRRRQCRNLKKGAEMGGKETLPRPRGGGGRRTKEKRGGTISGGGQGEKRKRLSKSFAGEKRLLQSSCGEPYGRTYSPRRSQKVKGTP